MKLVDTHTHTLHSFDGKASSFVMAQTAKDLGLTYMCITDHYDADYIHIPRYNFIRQLDMKAYIDDITKLKEIFPFIAMGVECGFSEAAEEDYLKNVPFEKMDYVLNSIHTADGLDAYNPEYFEKHGKTEGFKLYLKKVLRSLDARYPFNTISHIGFVRKNAPYDDVNMTMNDYGDILDAIFKKIIEKGKSLEINSNIRTRDFMPQAELVKRYRELGGESITFASDAHVPERICEMFTEACEMAKRAGFKYWTVYRNMKPQYVEIE